MVVLMVYRARNAHLVRALLIQVGSNADVRLWAFDDVVPELADRTVGCGSGTRFANLNKLYNSKPVDPRAWVMVADDDTFFVRGDLASMVTLMQRAEFSLAQPGQSALGWWSYVFNIARPYLTARETNYVEQGPIFIADPAMANEILPFPEDDSMGWGIEANWYRIKEGRYRIGIIDRCSMLHWSKPATDYPTQLEKTRMRQRLRNSQLHSIWQLQSGVGNWWRWQRRPRWASVRIDR